MAKQTKGGLQRFAEGNRVKKGKGMAALNVLGRIGSDADAAMASRRVGNTQFGDVGPSTQGIMKDVGGNWLSGSVEGSVKPLRQQLDRIPSLSQINSYDPAAHLANLEKIWTPEKIAEKKSFAPRIGTAVEEEKARLKGPAALNNWVDRNLTNYIKKQMATPDDPIRKLAEEGITHLPPDTRMPPNMSSVVESRKMAGFPEPMGKSDMAQKWEAWADKPIGFDTTGVMQNVGKGEPWMDKVDKFTRVHGVAPNYKNHMFTDLGFDHIVDVLKADLAAGRLRPEQLNKVSIEDAVRRTHQYNEDLAKKMQEARMAEIPEATVFKEYPEKYKWVQLDKPGQFAHESDVMGHSVRGYEPEQSHAEWITHSGEEGSPSYGHGGYEAIKAGKAKIYSLRDPKGESHATIEVGLPKLRTWDDVTKSVGKKRAAELHKEFYDIGADRTDDTQAAMAMFLQNKGVQPREYISQIKGKQNTTPNDEYQPFIRDFVKSGEWSEVKDLSNTGLYNLEDTIAPDTYAKYIENKLEVPRYATEAELQKLHNEYLKLAEPQNYKPDQEFAKGGKVTHSHHYHQIARDFDLPHLNEGGEVMEGDGHERHRVIQDLYATLADMKAKNSPKKFDKGGYAFQDPMGAPDSALSIDQQDYVQSFKDAGRNAYYNDKRHMVTPKGKKEFAQQALASYAGQPVDIANMLAGGLDATMGRAMGKAFPSLMKPVSVLDPNGEKVLAYPLSSDKPRGGSADQIERLGHDYEFYSAPLAAVAGDIGLGMAGPASRMLERGANRGYSAARRPFTPATMTIEATAPDLGQRTSMGYRQGLNDRLISSERGGTDLSNIGGRPTTRREGQGAWMGSQGFETNPLVAIDVPRAGDLSKNAEFRRTMAQAGTNLNQEGMAAHRFLPNLTSNPRDASAMLIKPKKGALSNEQVVGLAKELGNRMVVAHNPRLGGVVVHPFGEAAEGDKFVKQARAKARKVLGDDASIKYGRADINKDRAFMMGEDYAGAGAMPADESVRQVREMLKRQSREAFPNGDAPTGGVQPWSIGENYPTHVQGIGNGERVDYRPVNYATGEIGQTVPTYAEAEAGRGRMLNDHHRSLPKRVR